MSASERRAREKAQRRQEILEAARAVFYERGFRRPTMDDVAARAEISKGTIYLYFESKEAILAHLLLEGLDTLLAQIEAVYDPQSPAEAVLHYIAAAYLSFCQTHPNEFRLLMAFDRGRFEEVIPGDLYQEVVDKSLHGFNLVVEAIATGKRGGEFCVQDPRQAAGAFWAALNGVLVLMGNPIRRRIVGSDVNTMFEATLDLLIRGMCMNKFERAPGAPQMEVNS